MDIRIADAEDYVYAKKNPTWSDIKAVTKVAEEESESYHEAVERAQEDYQAYVYEQSITERAMQ